MDTTQENQKTPTLEMGYEPLGQHNGYARAAGGQAQATLCLGVVWLLWAGRTGGRFCTVCGAEGPAVAVVKVDPLKDLVIEEG